MNLQPNLSIHIKWEVQKMLSILFKAETLKLPMVKNQTFPTHEKFCKMQ